MDNFTKISPGYVRQSFEKQSDGKFVCVSQEFIFVDCVEYVDDFDEPIDPPDYEYQSYDMIVKD